MQFTCTEDGGGRRAASTKAILLSKLHRTHRTSTHALWYARCVHLGRGRSATAAVGIP